MLRSIGKESGESVESVLEVESVLMSAMMISRGADSGARRGGGMSQFRRPARPRHCRTMETRVGGGGGVDGTRVGRGPRRGSFVMICDRRRSESAPLGGGGGGDRFGVVPRSTDRRAA